jgi:hypothetical protein
MELISPQHKAMLRRFLELRDAKNETAAAAAAAKKEHDDAELELHDTLKEALAGTLKVDLGPPYGVVSFLPQESKKANVINEKKLMRYLEDRQLTEEYSSPGLVKGRLNEMIRDFDERNEEYPPGLEKFTKRYVRVTRPKGSK